jgi:UDP-N-acetyl-D-galactosamine dehydrogenase
MIKKNIPVKDANALVLGITFKENCPDIRNSRAIDVVNELKSYKINVDVYDPWATVSAVKHEYDVDLINDFKDIKKKYKAIIIVVAHEEFKQLDLSSVVDDNHIIYDVKAMLPKEQSDLRL